MPSGFKWKIWTIAASIALAVYVLVPAVWDIPPEMHNWLPQKGINLGLDLRGGIYVEMEVLIEEGLQSKLDLLAQDMQRDFDRRGLSSKFHQDPAHTFLDFVFGAPEPREAALRVVEKNYRDRFQKNESLGGEGFVLRLFFDDQYAQELRQDILSQALQAVRNRIDRYGLTEPNVQRHGSGRLVVELPGVQDPDRALAIIQQAGKLEFKLVNTSIQTAELGNKIAAARKKDPLAEGYSLEALRRLNEILKEGLPKETEAAFELARDPATGEVTKATPYLLNQTAYVTGEMLKDAQVQYDQRTSEPYVSLTFNTTGAKNFGDLTQAHVKEYLAILLDGNVMSAPVIQEPILNGQARITLGAGLNRQQTLKEAKDLTLVLQEGALPARLKELTKSVIGPTLGADSIEKSLKAMLIGTLVVVIFMVVYYNLSGFLANLALVLNTLFIFALLAMFQATLTLPGMAGIILSIGMAVDANILIFERIREELNAGRIAREAVESGYQNALRAIVDSNLTTIITGIILYQFGTGPIRGFAVTLIIGLVCNLYTAVFITRVVYDYFVVTRRVERLSI